MKRNKFVKCRHFYRNYEDITLRGKTYKHILVCNLEIFNIKRKRY